MSFGFLRDSLFFLSFLFILLYVPISIMVYSNNYYYYNYDESVSNKLNESQIKEITSDMTDFFLHKTNILNQNYGWNENELIHFKDVRKIYDVLFLIGIVSFLAFCKLFDRQKLIKYTKINFLIITSLILILPFFVYFWDNIFHQILFSNQYWISQSDSLMALLFEYSFFRNSLIFLIVIAGIINFIVLKKIKKEIRK